MNPFDKLTDMFREFPGIGPRQAKRFAHFLLAKDNSFIKELAETIEQTKKDTAMCSECLRFFSTNRKKTELCEICEDKNRNHSSLLIISRDVDLDIVEKSKSYDGYYFVLHGSVPILEAKPETKIRAKELLKLVGKRCESEKPIKEIILALNVNPEGENTAYYIEKLLTPLLDKYSIKIARLGRGLSTGTELEYSDTDTIKNALKNRA